MGNAFRCGWLPGCVVHRPDREAGRGCAASRGGEGRSALREHTPPAPARRKAFDRLFGNREMRVVMLGEPVGRRGQQAQGTAA